MKTFSPWVLALAIVILVPGFALADNYTWTFAGASISGSGVLTADSEGGGLYFITGGSGTIVDPSGTTAATFATCSFGNTCVVTNSGGDNGSYDNLLYPTLSAGSQLSSTGIDLVPGPDGTAFLNIWDSPSQSWAGWSYGSPAALSTPFTVSAVPDGGMTIMLLGGALVGLGTLRRRFRA
jgi:hypothetical protein